MASIANEVDSARQQVNTFADRVRTIRAALHEVVVGQDDVIDQLSWRRLPDVLFVPSVMLRDGRFLDDVTLNDVQDALDRPVVAVSPSPLSLAEAVGALAS